jgi:hypothetical protein
MSPLQSRFSAWNFTLLNVELQITDRTNNSKTEGPKWKDPDGRSI